MLWKNWKTVLLLCALTCLFYACAQPGTLTGGPEDKTPPILDRAASTPNLQTRFTKQTIELVFDEWLKLENTYKEIVVSPPLEFNPEVKLKGKKVRFNFHEEEILRSEATYTINFGKSVKDLNAGNVVEDLRFVFSTGDYIDSLEVKGKIVDASTNEGVADVLLMLYDNLSDTVVRTERPFYFARTDKSGMFKIENVKSDTFKVFGLVDNNFNYLFDSESEKIAFREAPIILPDSALTMIELQLFSEQARLRLLKKDTSTYGFVNLVFNDSPEKVQLLYQDSVPYIKQFDEDSLQLWYQLADNQSWPLYVPVDTLVDTLVLTASKKAAFMENTQLKAGKTASPQAINLNPTKAIRWPFNHPLTQIDTALIQCFEDTVKTLIPLDLEMDSTDRRALNLQYPWKEKTNYELLILPNALTDIYGLKNQDSIRQDYKVSERSEFGDIKLKIEKIPQGQYFVLQLLFKNDNLVDEFYVGGDSIFQKTYTALPPGNYSLSIIEDRNNNQRWDTGNYDRKEQPERRFSRSIEELRASWEVESTISLESLVQQ
ncbi:MAG: Ig-like domain-containing protein [Bacteroidota bacterium]